jgi:pimeloyl-ACP methyl ester carboxylesterase
METVVRTRDGVDLHVEVDEGPGPTVVLVHGFTARLEEFLLQRETLRGRARTVLYDCRGHGRSHGRSHGRGKVQGATIDQLGRDLAEVLDAVAPRGPVVLLGHSMGGMTIMALARQRPELFGERVVGAFLLATSSGGVAEAGPLGLLVRITRRLGLLQLFLWLTMLWSPVLERFRKRGTKVGRAFYRHYLFGTDDAEPELVTLVQDLLEQTPVTVTSGFYKTLLDHDEHASLAALRDIPVTLLVGDADRLTPESHSRRMAQELPDAELIVVPGAGHSVNITRQAVVDGALLRLLDRVAERRAA